MATSHDEETPVQMSDTEPLNFHVREIADAARGTYK
jgi:hypothetical protein